MNASYVNPCIVPPPQDRSYAPSPCPAYPSFPDGSLLSYLRKVTREEAPQESRPGSISEPYSFGKNLLTISNLAEKTTGNNQALQQAFTMAESHHHTEAQAEEEEEEEQEEEPEKELMDLVVTPSALATYTMTTLRQYIRMKGISPAGKRKQELIAAILEVCGDARLDRDSEGQRGAESLSEDSNSDGASETRPRRRRSVVSNTAGEKSPIKKRRKQPTVAAKKKKKTGTPHTKREGPLPMILNEKGELVYDRHAHLRNRENGSCHRCKNKKKLNVVCPFAKSHLFCRACVERHCGFDFDEMRNNVEKHWSNGCPVCRGDCDCAYCKRTKKAGVPSYTPVTSTTVVSPTTVSASNIKRGLKRKSPEKKTVKREPVDDEEEPEEVEDDIRMFLRSLKGEENDADSSCVGDQSPTPKRQPYRRAAAGRKKRRSADDYFVDEPQQDGIVRVTPAVIKKDGHYELLEKEASVEAFVGLTGAGSVLMSRHRTTISPPADD